MASVYRVGLTLIFLCCCVAGMILGYTWGIGGSILGVVLGAMLASVIALMLNTPERMETAFYSILTLIFIATTIYLIITFWGVRL
ncbi:hypothetical protein GTA62_02175 [Roseobacter sp. HKCCD9010]|uniref:hypothetical protein n=1 Tax=unclassified Roseobacter TaxID=196798 RepID=UPI001491A605|nr:MULTISPECIES: hypothetical protein [unclassified Roseobacter]MBF9049328.1 hypothetical protein [Rhodobacterales bacterium HKCCD4356]NNV11328.1 hypothetical protein [Roseobacter sp. HKCCD7357]NNV15512.1 hypothetical protein [Roseobacter sp. HKCCD8768]NNV24972.1 hypothetical protein [Roseobacter sp. HKCCD8192]NNV29229.1 hypothetical protein [Roseobacter sp. HKCCD9061]